MIFYIVEEQLKHAKEHCVEGAVISVKLLIQIQIQQCDVIGEFNSFLQPVEER